MADPETSPPKDAPRRVPIGLRIASETHPWLVAFSRWAVLGLTLGAVVLISLVDHYSGPRLRFSLFYLVPVGVATWLGGRYVGLAISFLSMMAWTLVDILDRDVRVYELVDYWNATTRLGFFLITAYLLDALKRALATEAGQANTDQLTGIANLRGFSDRLKTDLERLRREREPMTLIYFDLDRFKQVNDRFGHAAGDRLLERFAEQLSLGVRAGDIVGRLGGDEFACILTHTTEKEAAVVVERLHAFLTVWLKTTGYEVTLSMGAVTFLDAPDTAAEALQSADRAMYRAKAAGKNRYMLQTWPA